MGEPVTYPGHGRDGTGYLARPQGPAAPGVVVVRGAWGLVDHIHTVADRLAEAGYVALALDLDPSTSDGETLESAVAQIVGAAGTWLRAPRSPRWRCSASVRAAA